MKDPITLNLIKNALLEDAISKDITSGATFGKAKIMKEGILLAKEDLVLSGLDVVKDVLKEVSPEIRMVGKFKDGNFVQKGREIATIKGLVSDLLRAERVLLNFLQHLSGIATLTQQFVREVKPYKCQILDTRKTTPGFRFLEKKAVKDGGGANHRLNLSDQYLIKDNHIDACGGIVNAIKKVKQHKKKLGAKGTKILIEVETRNLKEVELAFKEGVDIILLDNMNLDQIKEAVALVNHRRLLEVSGGVNLKNVRKIAETGVERISIGALTHSAKAVDISFEIES